ncbi:uncharacterized protein K460DRAFT_406672 [Cucurbitaria berberidis CBS 394.84]|uniref:Uncharacterized protein n=1 Tax=Cucurbitaria berberidis CBS 394.84 TaxID=1168544 RepID=A0A9P4GHW3_9PLEO|nr:uncharacterized protein K460DRAFT_406672 [Cucurbitaria berberidis CBS 394.84]KAF1846468.1 hypothetical protein K460DRAFT_406672 [Cucurbitaria berberidis CBS 394.84]
MRDHLAATRGNSTDDRRHSSSTTTLLILPRELRDSIYGYLWDEETISNIRKSLKQAPDSFPDPHENINERRRPWFLDPRHLGQEVTEEIAESFFRHYNGFEMKSAQHIESILKHEFFGLNMRLCDHAISSLTVCVNLDRADAHHISRVELKAHLPKLVTLLPVLAPDFVLTFRFCSKYQVDFFGCVCRVQDQCPVRRNNIAFADSVSNTLQTVKDFVQDFESVRNRKVLLRLEVGRYYESLCRVVKGVIKLTLDDIDNDEATWLRRMTEIKESHEIVRSL